MSAFDRLNVVLNAFTSIATVVLAFFAYREIREGNRNKRSSAIAVRYLLLAEINRLVRPYQESLTRWTGTGYLSYSANTVFEGTSAALTEGVRQLPLLSEAEQERVSRFAYNLGQMSRGPHQDRFEAHERPNLEALVGFAQAASAALQNGVAKERLPWANASRTNELAS